MKGFVLFSSDDGGVVSLEFALILPVMVALLFGAVSAANLGRTSIKLWNAAQSMADIVSQQTTLSTTDMQDFCTGGRLALAPLNGTMTVTIASVTTSASGTTAVDWQDTASCGGTTMPDALTAAAPYVPNPKDSVIVVRATYVHTFPPSYILPKTITLTRTMFSRPRLGTTVKHS